MSFGKTLVTILFALVGAFSSGSFAAMEFKEADITTVKNIVERNEGSGAVPAKVNDKVGENSMVSTAASSMAELTFADTSITRMGSNTQFSFKSKERLVKLEQGTILIHTPPGNGGATVDCGGVTGAVSGTTFMASRDGVGNVLFVLLEGQGGLKVTAGGSTTVIRPGQAASVGAESIKEVAASAPNSEKSSAGPTAGSSSPGGDEKGPGPGAGAGPATGGGDTGGGGLPTPTPKIQVFDVDVKRVVATSPLLVEFKTELPSASKIEKVVETQQQAVKEGKLEKLEVEVVAVKTGDGDLLVGAPKVEREEFVVVNKKVDIVGQSVGGGDRIDIDTAAGPGAGSGPPVAAAPAPRAEAPVSPPPPAVNPVVSVIGQVATQTPAPVLAPSSLNLAFANGTGTITLDRAALQSTAVTLSGLSGLPTTVIIPAGSTSANFALPANPKNFFPGFADPGDPAAGYQPLTITATAGTLSASANAVPGWLDANVIRAENPVRRMLIQGSLDPAEAAALDAYFYFRNVASGSTVSFFDSVRTRTVDLGGILPVPIQSLAGSVDASKDYRFGGQLVSGANSSVNLGKTENIFFANQIRLGASPLSGGTALNWVSLADSTASWDIPDGNPAGASQQLNAAWSYDQLPLVARLNLKLSPLLSDSTGTDFYLGDFSAYLRHTSPGGETRTVRLFDRIGATDLDPTGSPATGLDVSLSDWGAANIKGQDTAGTLTGPLTGSFRPSYGGWSVSLNDLVSIDPNGAWTLFVADLASGAVGRVEDWSLELASVFQPQHSINLTVPSAGTSERMVTFASGDLGTSVLSTRLNADGAGVEFVSSGSVEMRQTQFENSGSKFTVEAKGKISLGAAPAASLETVDREQVRILANTVTAAGGEEVAVPGSLAVIRSGDALELRNVTIRSFAGTQLETVAGGMTTGRVLMSGASVRDFKIKELTGMAVNADAKIQMAAYDSAGKLEGEMVVEKGLPVATKLASQIDNSVTGTLGNTPVHAKDVELAARTVRFNDATLAAMSSITARANTILIQNSFMTVVQNSGMINMYVSTGLVNQGFGSVVDGRLNFAGLNTFTIGSNSFAIGNQAQLNAAYGTNLIEIPNGGTPQAGKVNVLKL